MTPKLLPEEFVTRIKATHCDGEALLEAIGREPWLSLRRNPEKNAGSYVPSETERDVVPWCADGFYLSSRPTFTLMPSFHAGAFYVQEASSMFLSAALSSAAPYLPQAPVCLDLCASPGGKTTLLMSRLHECGIIVANEVVRNRAWILRENAAKWGLPGTMVTNSSPKVIAASGVRFDLIVVDAPCSGEGMFRKDPTAIAEWNPRAAADCAVRQREILSDIWGALRPGGIMIYSTCTFNPDENEHNMEWAIETLGAENIRVQHPSSCGITTLEFRGGEGYAFYPHKVRGEGFFLCMLRKTDSSDSSVTHTSRREASVSAVKEYADAASYVCDLRAFAVGDDVVGWPTDRVQQMMRMASALKPLMVGTPIGSLTDKKGKKLFVPAPELPLSKAFNKASMECVDVDERTALKFLHGDTDLDLPPSADGWCAICHNGLGLGLVKRVGRRINNYYPKEWRIRMNVE